jgi:phosphatidylglycerol:prolipoprotein diacylglycerol transferase
MFAEIRIGIDPDIINLGGRVLTWHGFLTFVAVAVAVFLVARWSKKEGISVDAVYSVAVWAIIGGILGSRLFHVIDRWNDIYKHSPEDIVKVWQGGITIQGAILGGFALGAGYMLIRNHPRFLSLWDKRFRWLAGQPNRANLPSVGRLADIATPGLLIAMIIGRLGDIINGEHFSQATTLPWGFVYTHAKTATLYQLSGLNSFTPTHPAVVYEILLNLAVLGVVWALRNRLRPHGMLFVLYGTLYSTGRFFISFLRLDKDWVWDLNMAQLVAIALVVIATPILVYKAQIIKPARPRPSHPAKRRKR